MSQNYITIVGSFGFKDIGDEAMLTEDLAFLENELNIPASNIYIFGGDPEYLSRYHGHPRENCFSDIPLFYKAQSKFAPMWKRIRNIVKQFSIHRKIKNLGMNAAIQKSQILLVTGGGTINTRGKKAGSLERMHAFVKYFKFMKKPIFMSGQTIGPLGLYSDHDRMAREIVESVDVLTLRDRLYSRRYLEVIQAKPIRFIETYDDAYTLPYEEVKLDENLQVFLSSGATAAVCVTDYTTENSVQRAYIAELIEYLILQKSMRVILISHTPRDFYSLHIIRDMLRNDIKDRVLLPDLREERDKVLKKIISLCRIAIGGRYHFIVFAGTADVPFIGMCGNHYSYIKQDGFARQIEQERYILNERDTWSMDVMKTLIDERLEQKFELGRRFSRPSESMKLFKEWLIEKQFLKATRV